MQQIDKLNIYDMDNNVDMNKNNANNTNNTSNA